MAAARSTKTTPGSIPSGSRRKITDQRRRVALAEICLGMTCTPTRSEASEMIPNTASSETTTTTTIITAPSTSTPSLHQGTTETGTTGTLDNSTGMDDPANTTTAVADSTATQTETTTTIGNVSGAPQAEIIDFNSPDVITHWAEDWPPPPQQLTLGAFFPPLVKGTRTGRGNNHQKEAKTNDASTRTNARPSTTANQPDGYAELNVTDQSRPTSPGLIGNTSSQPISTAASSDNNDIPYTTGGDSYEEAEPSTCTSPPSLTDCAVAGPATSTNNTTTGGVIRDVASVQLGLTPGTRLQVQWKLSNGVLRWWGATLLPYEDGRVTSDTNQAIRVLDYDPYRQGGFPDRSQEDVVFQSDHELYTPEDHSDFYYRIEGDTWTPSPKPLEGMIGTTKKKKMTTTSIQSKETAVTANVAADSTVNTTAMTTTTSTTTSSSTTANGTTRVTSKGVVRNKAKSNNHEMTSPTETKLLDDGGKNHADLKESDHDQTSSPEIIDEETKKWLEKVSNMKAQYTTQAQTLLQRCKEIFQEEECLIEVVEPSSGNPDELVFDHESFPDSAVKTLASLIEGRREPWLPLAAMATRELNRLYQTNGFTESMTSSKIKVLAERKNHIKNAEAYLGGNPTSLNVPVNIFEDESPFWRWEITTLDLLPPSAVPAVKRARSTRRKLASHLNATIKLLASLDHKGVVLPDMRAKISQEEERVLRFVREEEKNRLASESKKIEQARRKEERRQQEEEKMARKEELTKEKQRKKLELVDLKKKKAAERQEEEERVKKREEELLAKQKNAMRSFLSSAKVTASKDTVVTQSEKASAGNQGHRIAESPPRRNSTSTEFDVESFRRQIGSGEVNFGTFAALSSSAMKSRKPRTRRVKLVVDVMVGNDSAFGAQPFLEQRVIEVSNKKKFLLFHEDIRPAYFGTWSKRSKIVTGRNPFGKERRLDYDYDSEAEWEEGDEEIGEDIENDAGDDEEDKDDEDDSVGEDGWLAADDDVDDNVDEDTKALRRKQIANRSRELHGELQVCLISPFAGQPLCVVKAPHDSSQLVKGVDVNEAKIILQSHNIEVIREAPICLEPFPPSLVDESPEPCRDCPTASPNENMSPSEKAAFARFVHNSTFGSKDKLIDELRSALPTTTSSRAQALRLLDTIAVKNKMPSGGFCWQVKEELRGDFGLAELADQNAGETRQEEIMKVIALAIHHGTFSSKEKAVDELRSAHAQLESISKAECLRQLETVAVKKRHPEAGIYWQVRREIKEKLGLSHLPDDPPLQPQQQQQQPQLNSSSDPSCTSSNPMAGVQPSESSGMKRNAEKASLEGSSKLMADFLKKKKL